MIGDGPERPDIEAYLRSGKYGGDVRFLGKQEQMEIILPIGDLFLLPSEYESFGLAALEAMAAGVPVVSSNAGGLSEINKEGFSGYLCEVGDVDSMAKKSLEVLSTVESLIKFKNSAREQALQFSIHRIVPQYENLYQELTSKN